MTKQNILLIGTCLALGLSCLSLSATASAVKEGDITLRVVRTAPDRYEAQMSGPTVGSHGAVTNIRLERGQDNYQAIVPLTERGHSGRGHRFAVMVQPQNMGQCEGSVLVGKGDLASIRLPLVLFAGVPQERAKQHYNCGTSQEQSIEWDQELGVAVGVGNHLANTAQLEGARFETLSRYYGQRVLLGKVMIEALDADRREGSPQRNLRAESNIYLDFSELNAELDDLIVITAKTPFMSGMVLPPGSKASQTFGVNITQKNRAPDNIRKMQAQSNTFSVQFYSANGLGNFQLKSDDSKHTLDYQVEKDSFTWRSPADEHVFNVDLQNISNLDFTIRTGEVAETLPAQTLLTDTLTIIISPAG
jgi:hypothetical protein